jgi:hypothetical protein
MHYSKGFGVQSPFAYSFITEIVNQTGLYYNYCELDKLYGANGNIRSRLAKLYFRLTNYCQPNVVVEYCTSTDSLEKAFHLAHDGIDFKRLDSSIIDVPYVENLTNIDIFRVVLDNYFRVVFERLLLKVTSNSVFILEGIHDNNETKAFWYEVVENKNVVVTFDLYYVGIVFFNKDYYKQNYVVNF